MANLYQIDAEIINCIDTETGEIIDMERWDQLHIDRETKIENIALYIKNLLSEAVAIKAEKDKLGERQKACENKAKRLKEYLSGYLSGEKFKSPRVVVSYRTSKAVDIQDLWKIPEEYLKYKDPDPDKSAIMKVLKAGKKVPGAQLVESQNIQIK